MLVVHPVMSILVPILLAESIYHQKANEPWVKPRTAFILLALFVANVFGLGRLIAPVNRPGIVYYLIELGIIGACVWLATCVPGPRTLAREPGPVRSSRWLYFAALAGTVITMVVSFVVPAVSMPATLQVMLMFGVLAAFLTFLNHNRVFDLDLDPLAKFAVAAGMISFWLLVSPLTMLSHHSPGPIVFAVLVVIILVRERKRLLFERR